jgi:hypothetical protein
MIKTKDKSKKIKVFSIFASLFFDNMTTRLARLARHINARMAELVDALVSNTSGRNAVPVRSRLRVLKKSESESES